MDDLEEFSKKCKYLTKIILYPQYNYVVAVCPKLNVKNQKVMALVQTHLCHNDCDLHRVIFSEEIIDKWDVQLFCIPNESPDMIKRAIDVMERMSLSKTQPRLKEMLDIDKQGFPKERYIDKKLKRE